MGYLLAIIILSILPQILVRSTYNKYNNIKVKNNKTGEMVVREMLERNNVNGIRINTIRGELTDYYNSKNKTINLSMSSYENPTIASIAVAAHETGHAIQDNKSYFFLKLRHLLGPATIVASNISWTFIYLGFFLYFDLLIFIGIIGLGVMLLFNVVTLPVELNASSRAKQFLISSGEYTREEIKGASKVLTAAAFTYIAVVLAGILQIIRLLSNFRDD